MRNRERARKRERERERERLCSFWERGGRREVFSLSISKTFSKLFTDFKTNGKKRVAALYLVCSRYLYQRSSTASGRRLTRGLLKVSAAEFFFLQNVGTELWSRNRINVL